MKYYLSILFYITIYIYNLENNEYTVVPKRLFCSLIFFSKYILKLKPFLSAL